MPADPDPSLPELSPAEWEVMKTLWEHDALAARDVFAALPEDDEGAPARGWAYRTVKTLLSRLVAKGAVEYQQVGNSYLYRAAVAQEDLTRQEVGGVLDRLTRHTGATGRRIVSSVIAQFLGDADLSDDEVRELQETLKKKRAEAKQSQPKKKPTRKPRGGKS